MLYIDDLLVCGPDDTKIEQVFKDLNTEDLSLTKEEDAWNDAFHFLGIELSFTKERMIKFTQHGIIKKLLQTTNMTE